MPILICRLPAQQSNSFRPRTRSQLTLCAAVIPLAAITAQQALQPAAAAVAASHWPVTLASGGIFLVCCAAAALLLSAIPLLWQLARTANRMESMLQTLETELPDTAASMRLSSLELSDCLSELGALGNDLSGGVRASARLVSTAEAGVRQGAQLMGASLVPALARRETQVRDVIESALKARAELAPKIPAVRAAVVATAVNARRLRGAILLSKLAAGAINLGRSFRRQVAVGVAERIREEQVIAAAEAAAYRRLQQQQRKNRQQHGR
eukprot:GHUV01036809.1.p1 GENE.GHUV01036809.1~~GHUV01036809.1.p1  ORF type:complete len:268 (+),score=73.86 GHUV01036809.1:615-1418(+)